MPQPLLNSSDTARLTDCLARIEQEDDASLRWEALDQLRYFCDGADIPLLEVIGGKKFSTLAVLVQLLQLAEELGGPAALRDAPPAHRVPLGLVLRLLETLMCNATANLKPFLKTKDGVRLLIAVLARCRDALVGMPDGEGLAILDHACNLLCYLTFHHPETAAAQFMAADGIAAASRVLECVRAHYARTLARPGSALPSRPPPEAPPARWDSLAADACELVANVASAHKGVGEGGGNAAGAASHEFTRSGALKSLAEMLPLLLGGRALDGGARLRGRAAPPCRLRRRVVRAQGGERPARGPRDRRASQRDGRAPRPPARRRARRRHAARRRRPRQPERRLARSAAVAAARSAAEARRPSPRLSGGSTRRRWSSSSTPSSRTARCRTRWRRGSRGRPSCCAPHRAGRHVLCDDRRVRAHPPQPLPRGRGGEGAAAALARALLGQGDAVPAAPHARHADVRAAAPLPLKHRRGGAPPRVRRALPDLALRAARLLLLRRRGIADLAECLRDYNTAIKATSLQILCVLAAESGAARHEMRQEEVLMEVLKTVQAFPAEDVTPHVLESALEAVSHRARVPRQPGLHPQRQRPRAPGRRARALREEQVAARNRRRQPAHRQDVAAARRATAGGARVPRAVERRVQNSENQQAALALGAVAQSLALLKSPAPGGAERGAVQAAALSLLVNLADTSEATQDALDDDEPAGIILGLLTASASAPIVCAACLLLSHVAWSHANNQRRYGTEASIRQLLALLSPAGRAAALGAHSSWGSERAAGAAAAGGTPTKQRRCWRRRRRRRRGARLGERAHPVRDARIS